MPFNDTWWPIYTLNCILFLLLLDGDECCVEVTCAGSTVNNGHDGPCSEIKCGPNARCRHEVFRGDQAETICVCNTGYTGDPDSADGCYEHNVSPDRQVKFSFQNYIAIMAITYSFKS